MPDVSIVFVAQQMPAFNSLTPRQSPSPMQESIQNLIETAESCDIWR